jgi:Protein of unknown function (DUF1573)
MNTLPKRLALLCGSTFCFLFVASLATYVIEYKPYGVPDSRRAEYEAMLASLKEQETLVAVLADKAKPKLRLEAKTYDFGMLDPHSTASHDFTLRNEGDDPLSVRVEGTSCKCTAGTVGKDILLPGETTTVKLTWNTGYKDEEFEQTATLRTNDPLRPEVTLTVKGQVRSDFVAPSHVEFKSGDLGEPIETTFVVYSQTWDDFTINDTTFGDSLGGTEWYAEPIEVTDARLADCGAKSAWEVHLSTIQMEYGSFAGELKLVADPCNSDKVQERTIDCAGNIRAPINFYGGDIHPKTGLDIGTVVATQAQVFHLVVRQRGEGDREIAVLDVEPKQLQASLEPMDGAPGNYRLTLKIPTDCPTLVFNAEQKHGYVQVGDPADKRFSNWFPLHGAIVGK